LTSFVFAISLKSYVKYTTIPLTSHTTCSKL